MQPQPYANAFRDLCTHNSCIFDESLTPLKPPQPYHQDLQEVGVASLLCKITASIYLSLTPLPKITNSLAVSRSNSGSKMNSEISPLTILSV